MLEARTADGHVFLVQRVTGEEEMNTLTFFSIFKSNGNVPLAKMVISRSATKVLALITDI
jgi:hypothetical protein